MIYGNQVYSLYQAGRSSILDAQMDGPSRDRSKLPLVSLRPNILISHHGTHD